MKLTTMLAAATIAAAGSTAATAQPTVYDGITFPEGDVSFVDAVVSYEPLFDGGPGPTSATFMDPASAIGPPDYSGGSSGTGSVSLGDGGRITLRFTDNALAGSGDSADDLHIFEIGAQVEDTFVEISTNGTTFISVGSANGSTSSIDIDPFLTAASIAPDTKFFFVRLTDDTDRDGQSGATVGADIDAVGAIRSVIPEPATIGVLAVGAATLAGRRRR